MPKYIATNKDREGKAVRIEGGYRASDGKAFLLLRRLPPEYAKPPLWLVQVSSDTLVQKDPATGESMSFEKLYSIHELTDAEKQFLLGTAPGKAALPFFNFSYPNVIRILGKKFTRLEEREIGPIVEGKLFVLIAGRTE